jgi:hypothetical protein
VRSGNSAACFPETLRSAGSSVASSRSASSGILGITRAAAMSCSPPGSRSHGGRASRLPPRHSPDRPRRCDVAFTFRVRAPSSSCFRLPPEHHRDHPRRCDVVFTSRVRCHGGRAFGLPRGHPRDHPRCCDDSVTFRGAVLSRSCLPGAFRTASGPSALVYRPRSPASPRRPRFCRRGVLREHREARAPESKTEGKIKAWCHAFGKSAIQLTKNGVTEVCRRAMAAITDRFNYEMLGATQT